MFRPGMYLLLVLVAAGLAYQMFTRVDRPHHDERLSRHQAIVGHTAPEPHRFRLLVPAVTEISTELLAPQVGVDRAFMASYLAYDLVAVLVSLVGVFALLAVLGFGPAPALAGSLLLACAIGVTMQDQWFQPWSLLEPGLLALGLATAFRGRWAALLGVTATYALTRETAILLGMGAILIAPRAWWSWGSLAVAAGVAGLLRAWVGPGAPEITLASRMALNMDPGHLRLAAQGMLLVLGPALLHALPGFRESPPPVRRLAWMIPVYVGLIGVFGVWREARLWLPLIPVGLALSWHGLFPRAAVVSTEAS